MHTQPSCGKSPRTQPSRHYTAKPTDRAMMFADGRVVIVSVDLTPAEAGQVCQMLMDYEAQHGRPPGSVRIFQTEDGAIEVEIATEIPQVTL